MGDSAGSFLLEKQPEADAVLAVLRGEAPIPTTTTAPPADERHGGGDHARGPPGRRAGHGAQRLRASRRGGQHRPGAPAEGLRERRRPRTTRAVSSTTARSGTPASDLAKAQLLQSIVPGAQLVEDSTLSGTDIVLVLGKDFHGLGSTATTGAPGATTTTLSPEAACV